MKSTANIENGIELIAEDITINYEMDPIEITNGHFVLKIPKRIWEKWQLKSDNPT